MPEPDDKLESEEEESSEEEREYIIMLIPPARVRLIGVNQITGQGWNR